MTKRLAILALAPILMLSPAFAEGPTGDAEAGAKVFNKCQTCHVVVNEAGETLAGKAGKTGPNLYGMPGRVIGSYPEFRYGDAIVAVGATGAVWDEESFVEYVADPAKFLKSTLDDKGAKTKMTFKLPKEQDARDVYAYIASLSPAPATAEPAAEAAPSN